MLYEIDVEGVLKREKAWVPGPAWEAFAQSTSGEYAVLLIDEVDKTNPGFDAFLLRLLEAGHFAHRTVTRLRLRNPTKIAVVLTSNGRRKLRPEVMVTLSESACPIAGKRSAHQNRSADLAHVKVPENLLQLVLRLGETVRRSVPESAPRPERTGYVLCGFAFTGADERS